MDYTLASTILIIAVTVGLSAYDLLPAFNSVSRDTLSAVLYTWSRDWWIIAYVWGVLGGHFFGGHAQATTTPVQDTYLTFWFMWVLMIVNVAHVKEQWPLLPTWCYLTLIMIGVLSGHFFWSQA